MSFKVPAKIVKLADSVHKNLIAARSAEAEIIEWFRSKGFEAGDNDAFGMLSNGEINGELFSDLLINAIENEEFEKVDG